MAVKKKAGAAKKASSRKRLSVKKARAKKPASTPRTSAPTGSENAVPAIDAVIKKYGTLPHPLEYKSPYQLLVMVVLSAQTNDALINRIAPGFFAAFPDLQSLRKKKPEDLFLPLKGVRNFANKARWLSAIADKLGPADQIPLSMAELTALPGIGRKSASVILRELGGQAEGIIVDLHVLRVIPRIGLSNKTDPSALEKDLLQILPKRQWKDAGMAVSFLGRDVCRPKPLCTSCVVRRFCTFASKLPPAP